jgi:hypothetical protein
MNKSLYLLTALCLFFSLVSCDSLRQEVNPDRLNREAAKLVVTCFLSPQDTVLAAKVARSETVLGESTGYFNAGVNVSDAIVTLSEGGRSVALRYDAKLGYYRATISQLPIVAGQTYSLVVQTPAGERAEASCTVPESVALNEIVIDSAVTNDFGLSTKRYYARLRWRDPVGRPNFYQLAGDNAYRTYYQPIPNAPSRDTLLTTRQSWNFTNGSTSTDVGRDGQDLLSVRGQLAMQLSWVNGIQLPSKPVGQINAYLLNVDQAYYQYQDAVERQSQVLGNPFAEPVPIPTNIQGALGCFGAYNRSALTMELK